MPTHFMNPAFEEKLKQLGYLYEREADSEAKTPHIILGDGSHSTGYFRSPVDNPDVMRTLSWELHDLLLKHGESYDKITLIIGPERETAPLVALLTLCFQERGRMTGRDIRACLTRKLGEGTADEHQEWVDCAGRLENGSSILVVENTITTGQTATGTVQAIQRQAEKLKLDGIRIVPVIGCLMNRTLQRTLNIGGREFRLAACLNKPFKNYPEHECDLCRIGSPAIDPRKGDWNELVSPS